MTRVSLAVADLRRLALPTISLTLAILSASQLSAQQSLDVAKGPISISATNASNLTIDVTEAAFTVLHVHNGIFGERQANTKVTVAGEKGKRSILGGGELTPALQIEHREIFGFPENARGGGVNVYVGGRFDVVDQNYAEYIDAAETTFNLDHKVGTAVALSLGASAFRGGGGWGDFTLGGAIEARRGWNSPGIRTPQSVCTDKTVRADTAGNPVRVTKCTDRIIGALEDATSAHARLDFVGLRFALARDSLGRGTGASVGLIGAASTDLRRGSAPAFNYGIGPAVFAPNYPDVVLAALLVEVLDATNASGQVPDRGDRVAIRLYFGIPFKF